MVTEIGARDLGDQQRYNMLEVSGTRCMAGVIWPNVRSRLLDFDQVLFCMFRDRDGVKVYKHTKKEWGQNPTILAEKAWPIKDLLFFWDTARNLERSRMMTRKTNLADKDIVPITFLKLWTWPF